MHRKDEHRTPSRYLAWRRQIGSSMTNYIALIGKDADSDFSVNFPDFPCWVSAGTTLDEARRMAGEAHQGGRRAGDDLLGLIAIP
jgi:hypothetical protein